jgi:hypothetical protein
MLEEFPSIPRFHLAVCMGQQEYLKYNNDEIAKTSFAN